MKCYFSYILGLALLLINVIHARSINTTAEKVDTKEDKYYLIYVNNQHGEYRVYQDGKNNLQRRSESQLFIENLVDEINDLILDHRDTYQNPEKLVEIEAAAQSMRKKKRSEEEAGQAQIYDENDFVYPISSVNDRVVLLAYLSNKLQKKIGSMENVTAVIPNSASLSIDQTSSHPKPYYDRDQILKETHWKDLAVQENAAVHLSIISQGQYNYRSGKAYDNNYYYPASAGEGIDLVILDSSFNFNYPEFANTDERIVKCAANVENGIAKTDRIDSYCGTPNPKAYHGETVSDVAAGLIYGSAKRANVYGISLSINASGEINNSDILAGMQFIYENLVRPHKTVINLSMSGIDFDGSDSEFYDHYQTVVTGIHKKGGIIVAAAGNAGYLLSNNSYGNIYSYPCQFKEVLCIGGIDNSDFKNHRNMYVFDTSSNYGSGVDFYAPFYVNATILMDGENTRIRHAGTSFSSPIVAGMVATMMSEHPEIEYTKEKIQQQLKENGKNMVITHLYSYERGILANNGKRSIYDETKEN